jgi:hypothetical protein
MHLRVVFYSWTYLYLHASVIVTTRVRRACALEIVAAVRACGWSKTDRTLMDGIHVQLTLCSVLHMHLHGLGRKTAAHTHKSPTSLV